MWKSVKDNEKLLPLNKYHSAQNFPFSIFEKKSESLKRFWLDFLIFTPENIFKRVSY
jgi:hypothetical protein